jgi:hypothetical protein
MAGLMSGDCSVVLIKVSATYIWLWEPLATGMPRSANGVSKWGTPRSQNKDPRACLPLSLFIVCYCADGHYWLCLPPALDATALSRFSSQRTNWVPSGT